MNPLTQTNTTLLTGLQPPHTRRSILATQSLRLKAQPSHGQTSLNKQHLEQLDQILNRFQHGIAFLSETEIANIQQASQQNTSVNLLRAPQNSNYLPFICLSAKEATIIAQEFDQLQLEYGAIRPRKIIIQGSVQPSTQEIYYFVGKHRYFTTKFLNEFIRKIQLNKDCNSFDFTDDYLQAKHFIIQTLIKGQVPSLLLQLIKNTPDTETQNTLVLLLCQNIKLAYAVFKTQAGQNGILNLKESLDEAQETALFIRCAAQVALEKGPPTKIMTRHPDSLSNFTDKARPSLIPKLHGLAPIFSTTGALYLKKTDSEEINCHQLKQALQKLAPSLTFNENAELENWLQNFTQLSENESRSLALITHHELVHYLQKFLQEPAQATLILTAKFCNTLLKHNAHSTSSLKSDDATYPKVVLHDHEIKKAAYAIKAFIFTELINAFLEKPKESVPLIIRTTTSALAVIHQTFKAVAENKTDSPEKLERVLNNLTERWIFK